MAQYVFEFGAENLNPIRETILGVAGERPTDLYALRAEDVISLNYSKTDKGIDYEFENLGSGKNISIIARFEVIAVKYALVVAPHFNRQNLSLWLGTLESNELDWHSLWTSILVHKGLRFACLGLEEGVEIEDGHLTVDTFPWTAWPIMVGALRVDPLASGDWVIKSTPDNPE
jgi:hypothetical protein